MRYIGIDLLKVPALSTAVPLRLEAILLGNVYIGIAATPILLLLLSNLTTPLFTGVIHQMSFMTSPLEPHWILLKTKAGPLATFLKWAEW
jgi:hypothetical protein